MSIKNIVLSPDSILSFNEQNFIKGGDGVKVDKPTEEDLEKIRESLGKMVQRLTHAIMHKGLTVES